MPTYSNRLCHILLTVVIVYHVRCSLAQRVYHINRQDRQSLGELKSYYPHYTDGELRHKQIKRLEQGHTGRPHYLDKKRSYLSQSSVLTTNSILQLCVQYYYLKYQT